jgi:superfamily II DNA/RNA helicase
VITSETDKLLKEEIIADMQNPNGSIKILIATSTISMGVNIKGIVSRVYAINFSDC